jgi:hypothetical protein
MTTGCDKGDRREYIEMILIGELELLCEFRHVPCPSNENIGERPLRSFLSRL